MKNGTALVLLSLSCALCPLGGEGGTIHRSFNGGYPTTVSDARRQSVSVGPTTGATIQKKQGKQSAKSSAKAPNKLFGTAKCVGESSDSIKVTNSEGEHLVLLDKIAAPSTNDVASCKMAAKLLHDLVDGKEVEVLWNERRKGHIVGVVYFKHPQGMVEVNLTLVKNGCAKQAMTDRTAAYTSAERDARKNKRGMWAGK
jgi:endonuclease YncB( thermonuclease family)